MGEYLDQIPGNIRKHIQGITQSIQATGDEDTLEKVAQAWLEKKEAFENQIAEMNMEEIGNLPKDDERGALALTYSGSLVNIGPLVDGVRDVTYTSIGFRTDAPKSAEKSNSRLAGDVEVDKIIEFAVGPVKSTSQIFKVAVCKNQDMSAEEQQKTIFDAATILEEEFVEVNNTVMMD